MSNSAGQLAMGVSVAIQACECTEFDFTDFGKTNKNQIPFDGYAFNLNINFRIDEVTKTIFIEVTSSLFLNSVENKQDIANLKSINKFFITNFDEIANKTERGIEVPHQVLPPLLGMCISGLRGMYSVKLEGSIYSNAILPIIDPNKIVAQPLVALG